MVCNVHLGLVEELLEVSGGDRRRATLRPSRAGDVRPPTDGAGDRGGQKGGRPVPLTRNYPTGRGRRVALRQTRAAWSPKRWCPRPDRRGGRPARSGRTSGTARRAARSTPGAMDVDRGVGAIAAPAGRRTSAGPDATPRRGHHRPSAAGRTGAAFSSTSRQLPRRVELDSVVGGKSAEGVPEEGGQVVRRRLAGHDVATQPPLGDGQPHARPPRAPPAPRRRVDAEARAGCHPSAWRGWWRSAPCRRRAGRRNFRCSISSRNTCGCSARRPEVVVARRGTPCRASERRVTRVEPARPESPGSAPHCPTAR